ncbi:acyl-CoA dehydrogenase [Sphingopyxis terrae subsp. terrae NBRC 15098]|uniref:Acyl-CoA dehydrogenase n=1 Tax=Sphingopyxis terrae subsp. terrae NBRC 15098 TaxID=1219058 RepID=A0A142VUD3_9SPHN|nr:acyl-CoA dehydrogenase family protein [Sphingopyxis terrae]AMU93339.1 acyl-CoA dehydrogenase [Sphingopyxis terrae subsp. terrae NBRC 15098]
MTADPIQRQGREAFRQEVRGWIAANLTDDLRDAAARATSVFVDKPHAMAWQAILHRHGWAAPHWPREYGGTGWDETQRHIFDSELAAAGAPSLSPMGLRMVAPCIMRFGTPEQKAHYLPRILSGEDFWCQGYSEPQAGSDLASLSLRAERDGDDYVLTGSKIWTTHAHFANRMFCLVRTSRDGRPQQGITFLLLDMTLPGIEVRPILTLSGDHDFNQVFFDNVRVPQSGRLGEEDRGWGVAKYLLEFERSAAYAAGLTAALDRLLAGAAARDFGEGGTLLDDPAIRRRFARLYTDVHAIHAAEQRMMAAIALGRSPGPASSMLKVQGTEAQQRIQELAVDIAGPYAAPHQFAARAPGSNLPFVGPEDDLTASARYFNGRAASIYGGSNEIQRNIMAKLMLGL